MPIILAFMTLSWEDGEFEASLGYFVCLSSCHTYKEKKTKENKTKEKKKKYIFY
jgi:hypothetical protein